MVVFIKLHRDYPQLRYLPFYSLYRGGSRGRVQGVGGGGVEAEQETSAPPPKKNPGTAPVINCNKHYSLHILSCLVSL